MMYKLMIVDDEQIEREGMAQFIPWENYDVELCATAWNGLDAFEQIQKIQPDILLTDIKMPVMNGIELIEKLADTYPGICVIVLSGYGEYEYTSQAMELGVRHYLLKPCDEEKIVTVLNEAKKEVDQKRMAQIKQKEYHTIRRQLLPHAKEEMLRGMMKDRKLSEEEMLLLKKDLPDAGEHLKLLAMKNSQMRMEYLEQFMLGNILGEFLGMKKMPLFTSVDDMVLFLVEDRSTEELTEAVKKTLQEFAKIKTRKIITAISTGGKIEKIKELFAQIICLFEMGEGMENGACLSYPEQTDEIGKSTYYFDFDQIRKAKQYDQVLFEITLGFKKMESQLLSTEQKQKVCHAFLVTFGMPFVENGKYLETGQQENDLIGVLSDQVAMSLGVYRSDKEGTRMQQILSVVYQNLDNTGLNIQYMAKNVLFMNEDYFGRIFMRYNHIKFSSYLEQCRIEMSKRLLCYDPDMKITKITELVGYPQDGQYFSKAFRKVCGQTPTEYKEQLKKHE